MSRSRMSVGDSARLFHALSDETRLAILGLLCRGERCVCDLQEALDSHQSRLSFHLRVLREAGLVKDRKEGRWSYYAIEPSALDAAAQAALAMIPGTASTIELHQLVRKRPERIPARSPVRGGLSGDSGSCCS
jgi:ArsR family transcriptional regulator